MEATIPRPDPRSPASWCHEGVAHDHRACGTLWDSADPQDIERAARWADDHPTVDRNPPTVDAIMSMVFEYGAARLLRNVSTPTRRQKGDPRYAQAHARDVAECARLERAIRAALRRAGVPGERPTT